MREQVMHVVFYQHIHQLHSLSCDIASASHLQQVLEPAHHPHKVRLAREQVPLALHYQVHHFQRPLNQLPCPFLVDEGAAFGAEKGGEGSAGAGACRWAVCGGGAQRGWHL